jgi:hypothetical protein
VVVVVAVQDHQAVAVVQVVVLRALLEMRPLLQQQQTQVVVAVALVMTSV